MAMAYVEYALDSALRRKLVTARQLARTVVPPAGGATGSSDLAWPRHRRTVEADSIKHHFDHGSFQGDRTKRNELQLAGWKVLSFTWRDHTERPKWLVETVRKALALELTPRMGRLSDPSDGIAAGG